MRQRIFSFYANRYSKNTPNSTAQHDKKYLLTIQKFTLTAEYRFSAKNKGLHSRRYRLIIAILRVKGNLFQFWHILLSHCCFPVKRSSAAFLHYFETRERKRRQKFSLIGLLKGEE